MLQRSCFGSVTTQQTAPISANIQQLLPLHIINSSPALIISAFRLHLAILQKSSKFHFVPPGNAAYIICAILLSFCYQYLSRITFPLWRLPCSMRSQKRRQVIHWTTGKNATVVFFWRAISVLDVVKSNVLWKHSALCGDVFGQLSDARLISFSLNSMLKSYVVPLHFLLSPLITPNLFPPYVFVTL